MKIKIAIGCIFYNSVIELTRLLDSIPPNQIDYFIGVDGIFKYTKEKYSDLPELSTDGSRELLIPEYSNKKLFVSALVDKPNSTEYEKRNAYLETLEKLDKDIDVLIISDSDEFFSYPDPTITREEAWNRFKKNLEFEIRKYPFHNVFGIGTYNVQEKSSSYCPRIWYKPHEMRYINGSHYHYANTIREKETIDNFKKNRLNYCQQAQAIIKSGFVLAHDHSLRNQDYMKRREEYQRYLVKFEELTQSHRFTIEECHKMAKESPHIQFKPTN